MALAHRPFVFLDVETTGTSPYNARVIEVGALRVENMQIVKSYKQLIYPEISIPRFITRLTNISDADVWDMPTFAGIADDLESLLHDAIFVAHNVGFDYAFIQQEYARLRRPFISDRFCTARLSRRLFPDQRRHSLDAIIERHDYSVLNRHRAYDDAHILFQFFTDAVAESEIEVYRIIDQIMVRSRPSATPYAL